MNLSTLKSLTGLKKYTTAFTLGALMTLSTPPIGIFPILLLCIPGFIWLAQNSTTKRETFLTGWAFGAGYFIFGLYWVSFALLVDFEHFWWAMPFSAILGPAVVALYYALIPLLAWRYRKNDTAYALMFAAAFALTEWVRGHALTGFPWNLPGYTWADFPPVMQANAAVGIYGVTLLTLLWAVLPYLGKRWAQSASVAFLLITAAGGARLYLHPTQPSGSTVRIVQTNIPQSLKWSRQEMWNNFEHNLSLTATPAKMPITFTVWPETAVMADLGSELNIAKDIAAHLPKGSIGLIGTLRVIGKGDEFYNSVTVLDDKGQVIDNYNKYHLVPFGEYVPFRKYINLTPIGNGVADIGDFTRGPGVTTMHLDHLPKPSSLVCYEAIFPHEVAQLDDRPDWLLNVTNDGWYGKTAGPHQHFENARIRAVEEGLPLVRAANTGISATIDPLGRIIGEEPLYKTGVVDTILPAALPPTLYARFGDTLFFLMLVLLGIAGEVVYRKE